MTTLVLWVSNADSVIYDPVLDTGSPKDKIPKSLCPYARLTGTIIQNSTSFYVYRPTSDTTCAEDLWDSSSGVWITTNMAIPTPEAHSPPIHALVPRIGFLGSSSRLRSALPARDALLVATDDREWRGCLSQSPDCVCFT